MATIAYELPETYASITRPVAYEIIKQLRDNLGIINKDIPITFPNANGKHTVWNGNNIAEQSSADFKSSERLFIDIKEDYMEEDLMVMTSRKRDNPPIFIDSKYNIIITPVYSRTKVTMSVRYRTRDRFQAESFRDYWRRKLADNREYMVFNARYLYPIPEDIEKGLYLLYNTRKVNNDDYPTYQHYLFGLGSKHLTSLTNTKGKGDTLAMAECQENIYGQFTDPSSMEIEKDEVGAVWVAQFDFEYSYDKVISVVLDYPILIHNELVPYQLYPEQFFDIATLKTHSSRTREFYTIIERDMGFRWHIQGAYIRIPEFDDWSQHIRWKDFRSLVSVLITVEDDNPKSICNLTDLGDWGLHPALHRSFKENCDLLTLQYEFPFYVSLYNGNSLFGDDYIVTDNELEVTSRFPLRKENVHHLMISIVRDISLLTPEAQKRFFSDPQLVYAYLDVLTGSQPAGGYPKVNAGGHVDIEDFKRVIKDSHLNRRQNYLGIGSAMATVGIFSVDTHQLTELKA